ncbi:unnamed protein product, partial [Ectocarpus sp. 12 AP-2014]
VDDFVGSRTSTGRVGDTPGARVERELPLSPARSPVPATPDPASSALPTLTVVRSKVVSAGCAVANEMAVDGIDARLELATDTPACSFSPSTAVDDSPRWDRLLRPAGSVRRGLRLPSIADGVNPSAKSNLALS